MNQFDALWMAGLLSADFSLRLTLTLIHFLWQGCAVAGGVAIAGYLLRGAPARHRYVINVVGLVLMAACVPVTYSWLRFSERESLQATIERSGANHSAEMLDSVSQRRVDSPGEWMSSGISRGDGESVADERLVGAIGQAPEVSTFAIANRSWMTPYARYASGIYLAGVLAMFLRLMLAHWGGWRLRQAASTTVDDQLLAMVLRQAKRLGIAAAPSIAWCQRVTVPVVVGILRPLILLPTSLASGLSPQQLESLLAHELAHIRRLDLLVNLLQRLFEAVLFFHPAVWYVSRRVSIERENACDDLVVASGWQRVQYADALLRMAEICAALRGDKLVAEAALLAATGENASQFKRRVLRLLGGEPAARLKLGRAGVAGMLLLFGSLALAIWTGTRAGDAHEVDVAASSGSDSLGEPLDVKTEDLTPAKIAEQMEATMQRFAAAEYAASFTETRDANAGYGDKPPLLVDGQGSFLYRSDGTRWFADEHGFNISLGQPGAMPVHVRSGFDGDKYFFAQDDSLVRLTLGEIELTGQRLEPRFIFWHGARSAEWTLQAVKYFNARIDRREMIAGHECVIVISEPGKPRPSDKAEKSSSQRYDWLSEITISPQQSWLPLKTVIHLNGKPYSTETIEKLAQTPEGVWYPEVIRFEQHLLPEYFMKKETRITRFRLRDRFAENEFRQVDSLPIGYDIVDYRRDRVWHNDPWWPDLAPWLAEHLDWPRPDLSGLSNLGSNANGKIHGQPAPAIQAAQWLNGDPGGWSRAGRKLTVLMFFGGDSISPTTRWIAGLKGLQERYGQGGLDVVGVATSMVDPATVRRTIKSLDIRFPVAIDTSDSDNKGYGRTFNAYGMKTYGGVFLIDANGRALSVIPEDRPSGANISQLENLIRQQGLASLQKNDKPNGDAKSNPAGLEDSSRLSDTELEQIEAEWKRLRMAKPGDAQLWVKLRFPGGTRPNDGQKANLDIVPELRLLGSSTPGGWTLLRAGRLQISSDDGCDVTGLPKGSYALTITRPGFASTERTIALPVVEVGKPLDIQMIPGDTIRGQIVDPAGQPIVGAKLQAKKRHWDPKLPQLYTTAHLPRETATDNQGRFEFRSLFEGSFTFEVTADGFQSANVPVIPVGTQDVKVTLRQMGAATEPPDATKNKEQLKDDAAAGNAIQPPQTRTQSLDIIVAKHVLLWDGEIVTWGNILAKLRKLRTQNGAPLHPNFHFTNAAAEAGKLDHYQDAIFEVYKELFEPAGVSVRFISPRAAPRYDAIRTPDDLVPKPEHIRRGSVHAADGTPIAAATVVLMPEDAVGPIMLNSDLALRDPLDEVWASTGSDGHFEIVAPGTGYRLAILSPHGFALVSVPKSVTAEIKLAPLARVELSGEVGKKQSIDLSLHLADMPDSSPGFAIYGLSLEADLLKNPLPPGKITVSRSFAQEDGSSIVKPAASFSLAAGQVKSLTLLAKEANE